VLRLRDRDAICTDDVMQRREQIRVTQPIGDDTVDVRQLAVYGMRAIDAHDRTDPNGRVECGPEVKLVRRVGAALSGDHAAQRNGCGFFTNSIGPLPVIGTHRGT
jgi:hypothetical protein